MTRREERQQAFAIIFEKSFRDDSLEDIIEDAKNADAYKENAYCNEVIFGVFKNLESIDLIIKQNLKDWSIDRISKVALSLLRLAIYEIKYINNIPSGVSANEAVELSKLYATEEDAAFINGVLGSVIRAE